MKAHHTMTNNYFAKTYQAIKFIAALALVSSSLTVVSATEQKNEQRDEQEQESSDSVKFSEIKKPKAVATGDKIYTWIDESGNRIYSDVPHKDATLMRIEKGTDYTDPNKLRNRGATMRPKVVPTGDMYQHFAIISPSNDQTIRNNSGDFQVAIDIRPKLVSGHSIRLSINGQLVQNTASSFMSLANIDRGTHTLVAQIVDAKGKKLRTSKPVIIHLHRAH